MDVLGQSQGPTCCRLCGHPSLRAMAVLDFVVVLDQSNAGVKSNSYTHILLVPLPPLHCCDSPCMYMELTHDTMSRMNTAFVLLNLSPSYPPNHTILLLSTRVRVMPEDGGGVVPAVDRVDHCPEGWRKAFLDCPLSLEWDTRTQLISPPKKAQGCWYLLSLSSPLMCTSYHMIYYICIHLTSNNPCEKCGGVWCAFCMSLSTYCCKATLI